MDNEKIAPSSTTKATAKWQEKAGLISKSYKLKADDVEQFAAACEAAGRSQASVLTEFMRFFVAEGATSGSDAESWLRRLKRWLKRA